MNSKAAWHSLLPGFGCRSVAAVQEWVRTPVARNTSGGSPPGQRLLCRCIEAMLRLQRLPGAGAAGWCRAAVQHNSSSEQQRDRQAAAAQASRGPGSGAAARAWALPPPWPWRQHTPCCPCHPPHHPAMLARAPPGPAQQPEPEHQQLSLAQALRRHCWPGHWRRQPRPCLPEPHSAVAAAQP
ncbi:hypothetical protein HaLaN_28003 [Haematococcus lacustris]|uniref:Uncharacterized protein n=1 Tax=Haematococcus lacustris TaxID=44745 RepID=A0A6A0ABT7_HAELA|nr:hypothetical protein HaLaN_28003 [Haematococcus lacustris]